MSLRDEYNALMDTLDVPTAGHDELVSLAHLIEPHPAEAREILRHRDDDTAT